MRLSQAGFQNRPYARQAFTEWGFYASIPLAIQEPDLTLMRKTLSLVIACLFALSLTAVAQADPFYLETAGVTIEVPEGMTATDQSTNDSYLLSITVDEDASLKYAYSLTYIQEFAGKNIEDLTDEEGQALLRRLKPPGLRRARIL